MPDAVELEADDRRADLAAALEAVEAKATPEPAAAAQEPVNAAEPAAQAEAPDGRVRDEKGRFAPAAKGDASPLASAKVQEGVAPPSTVGVIGQAAPTPPAPSFKPPQSWKPDVRELAAKLPAEFQPILEEAMRRDRETAIAIQKAATTQQQLEPLMRTVQPYAQGLQQRGLNVESVIGNMLRTEQSLSHPDERVRAQVLAQALGTYRVSVEALASALDATPQPAQGQQSQTIDPTAIARQVKDEIQREMNDRSIKQELEAFEPQAEFFKDVEIAVASLLDAHARAGIDLSLKDAYEQACWADPRIRGILQQREASKQAATGSQATQRAHAASSSIKSQPGGATKNGTPLGDSWREHLEAAQARLNEK